jgi:hypothetical protein
MSFGLFRVASLLLSERITVNGFPLTTSTTDDALQTAVC